MISCLDKARNLLTSHVDFSEDVSKAPFEMYYEEQMKILQDANWYYTNVEDMGRCVFHKGAQITIECIIKLYNILSNPPYNVKYFKTLPLTTDDLERFFGTIKGMWSNRYV